MRLARLRRATNPEVSQAPGRTAAVPSGTQSGTTKASWVAVKRVVSGPGNGIAKDCTPPPQVVPAKPRKWLRLVGGLAVFLLSDGYLANGSEPWRVPEVDELPDLRVQFAQGGGARAGGLAGGAHDAAADDQEALPTAAVGPSPLEGM